MKLTKKEKAMICDELLARAGAWQVEKLDEPRGHAIIEISHRVLDSLPGDSWNEYASALLHEATWYLADDEVIE